MTVHIEVEGQNIPFRLNWEEGRWESLDKHEEEHFPLIIEVNGTRYELHSDETFEEVEK